MFEMEAILYEKLDGSVLLMIAQVEVRKVFNIYLLRAMIRRLQLIDFKKFYKRESG